MTNENTIPEEHVEKMQSGTGCLGQLGWFFGGTVLPMGSLSFYRKAAQKSVGSAILFFVIFTVTISALSSVAVAVNTFSVIGSIQQAYADGKVPEITIANGVAEVNGDQPFILLDAADSSGRYILVAVDTTGKLRQIDNQKYDQGFLLTRTELQVLSRQNGLQAIPLSQLHIMFDRDPIIINAQTVSQAWGIMSVVIVIFVFAFLVLWFTVMRLMIISMIALIIWGIVTLLKPNTGFGPIIITGLYAIIPAIYLSHLFSRADFSFPGIQTFLLLIFWSMGLIVNLVNNEFLATEPPLRLWTALIGLPMLIIFIVDMFWKFPLPYGPIILWVVTVLTGLALAGIRLYFRFSANKPEPIVT